MIFPRRQRGLRIEMRSPAPIRRGRRHAGIRGGYSLRTPVNRLPDAAVRSTPADVIRNDRINVGVGRLRLFREQSAGLHDHSGLAVAALRDILVQPRTLTRM